MADNTISNFIGGFQDGGARPNLFAVTINQGAGAGFEFHCNCWHLAKYDDIHSG